MSDLPRRRGGQPGNLNARKHGFYSYALDGNEKAMLAEAGQIIGLDDEIALVRTRLRVAVKRDPNNLRLISETASTLARLICTNHKLGFGKRESLERIRFNILNEFGRILGQDDKEVDRQFLGSVLDKPESVQPPP